MLQIRKVKPVGVSRKRYEDYLHIMEIMDKGMEQRGITYNMIRNRNDDDYKVIRVPYIYDNND